MTSPFVDVLDLLDLGVVEERDLRVRRGLSCIIFDARSVSRRWMSVTLRGQLREVDRLLHRRVAAADDGHAAALEEEAVARRAGETPLPDSCVSTPRPSHFADAPVAMMIACAVYVVLPDHDRERARREVDPCHVPWTISAPKRSACARSAASGRAP